MNIVRSTAAYERRLRKQLHGDFVEKDLDEKHAKMAADAFQFLRATYWRWAETILTTCPELGDAPAVLAVGDIHVENFGSWRDREGRLVWGVNDFDETAKMPYVLDLVQARHERGAGQGSWAFCPPDLCRHFGRISRRPRQPEALRSRPSIRVAERESCRARGGTAEILGQIRPEETQEEGNDHRQEAQHPAPLRHGADVGTT